ncbi:MAG: type I 3-dehydroquinate dehydratase, partial [Acidobacteria bacterium]|nr:type I 3-dehydroquinate dehydratase [Acidobacteriota bacterium]
MRQTTLVAVLDHAARPADVLEAAGDAQWLELRADASSDFDPDWLRGRFRGLLLYSLHGHGPSRERRLLRAAEHFDLIDLGVADLSPEILAAIPPGKRVISADLANASLAELRHAAAGMTQIPARLYRLTTRAPHSGDELAPLQLLRELQRDDVTAFATGPTGLWTRIVAPHLGARVVFGSASGDDALSGAPSVQRLVDAFGFPSLPDITEIYGMAGDPVRHSLSPRIHNTAYRALGKSALYVPFHAPDFDLFWNRIVLSGAIEKLGFALKGLSVVSPHKTAALGAARYQSSIVQRAQSTNLFHRAADGEWFAESTDADGVMLTLRERGIHPHKRRVAVIGCGGSGRAMAAALHDAGADVTLVNRGM